MHFRKSSVLILSVVMLSAVACGQHEMSEIHFGTLNKNTVPQDAPRDDEPIPEEAGQKEGHFKAVLWTLNGQVSGNKTVGDANLVIKEGMLMVEVKVDGSPVNITHIQHIHSGTKCPLIANDENEDEFIDAMEGISSYGPILLDLDGDLTNQGEGNEAFPEADAIGSYNYFQTAPLDDVLADGPLNLEGKTIVIHGVPVETELPDTVAGMDELSAQESLPIACGEIKLATDSGGK